MAWHRFNGAWECLAVHFSEITINMKIIGTHQVLMRCFNPFNTNNSSTKNLPTKYILLPANGVECKKEEKKKPKFFRETMSKTNLFYRNLIVMRILSTRFHVNINNFLTSHCSDLVVVELSWLNAFHLHYERCSTYFMTTFAAWIFEQEYSKQKYSKQHLLIAILIICLILFIDVIVVVVVVCMDFLAMIFAFVISEIFFLPIISNQTEPHAQLNRICSFARSFIRAW